MMVLARASIASAERDGGRLCSKGTSLLKAGMEGLEIEWLIFEVMFSHNLFMLL